MSTKKSLFGTLSVSSAIVSVVSAVVFIASGAVLAAMSEEVLVVVQMLSLLLTPLSAIVGLILGIVGIFQDRTNTKSKIGVSINAVLIVLQVAGVLFLMTASVSFS